MDSYYAHALEGASGVELTIALYDGIIRFMYNAIDAVERNDADQRRAAVKRAMDIVVHLQATLDKDVGGEPAKALEEFYVAMFALMLQGSQANSKRKFEQVIANVRNVRDAWKQVGKDPDSTSPASGAHSVASGVDPQADSEFSSFPATHAAASWTA
ncbi:MAG TPA: flagellar export chaperone FliS [Terracidiphilus sp.]|jgi:flagellar protein FliS